MEDHPADITSYIPGLRRYATALIRNPVEAEDLVQECLCRAIARARPWHAIKDVRAYLFTILHNLYVDKIVKRRNGEEVVSDEVAERKLVVKPAQLGRLEIRDLGWALEQLSPDQRQVTLLVGLEGMTYEGAARVLGVPTGTIMSRLSRARETLRKLMDGEGPEQTGAQKIDGHGISDKDGWTQLRSRG